MWKQSLLKPMSRAMNSLLISPGILQAESRRVLYFTFSLCWLWAIPSQGPLRQIRILLMKEMKRGQADPEGMFRNSNCTGRQEQAGKPQLLPGALSPPLEQPMLCHSPGHGGGKERDRIAFELFYICCRVFFRGNSVGRARSGMRAGDKKQTEAMTTKKMSRAPGSQGTGNAA